MTKPMKFDELINNIRTCCRSTESECVAYQAIRKQVADLTDESCCALDVMDTFERIADLAYDAAWKEADEYYASIAVHYEA